MPDYSANEIVDILLTLGECQRNYRAAARLYIARFPQRRHPHHTVIRDIEIRSRQGHFVRRRRMNEYDNNPRLLAVVAMVTLNVHVSLREIELTLGISRSSASRYLRSVNYHPYHVTLNHAVTELDHQRRLNFCQWARQQIDNDEHFFNYVLFSDEATFESTGILNRHNSHYWSPVNPHWMIEVDRQHRWSVMVWCGIVNGYLVGPYFFDGNVNGQSYLHLLRDELPVLLENVDLATRARMWFQHDGAAPHNARIVREFLNVMFNNQWIGRGGPTEWPTRSPDLTSPDFYLWGYLKNAVYRDRPNNRMDMIQRIRTACQNIPRQVLLSTITHFQRRIELCEQVNGATFEHLLP